MKRLQYLGFLLVMNFIITNKLLTQAVRFDCDFNDQTANNLSTTHSCISNSNDESDQNNLYLPNQEDDRDVKVIKIALHIMHPEDPITGEIDLNNPKNFHTPEELAWVRSVFSNDANNFMQNLVCPVYNPPSSEDCEDCNGFNPPECACTGQDFFTDTKIRFEINEEDVYLHADNIGFLNNGAGCDNSQAGRYNVNTYGDPCKLNVFLIGEITPRFGGCGNAYFGESANFIWYKGLYQRYTENNGIAWYVSRVHVHEVGHALGMLHAEFTEDQFPDLVNNIPGATINANNEMNIPTCPDDGAYDPVNNPFGFPNFGTNNTMSGSWRSQLGTLTPLQIGQMHRMLLSGWRSKWLSHEYDGSRTVTIPSGTNETWENARLIHGDVVVESGARLSIKCKVIMPPTGRIIVEKGAKLTVNGGLITVAAAECGNYWQGIQVHGNPNLPHSINSSEHGAVILSNGATLEFARTAIKLDHDNGGGTGGILWCINANFINNNRAIAFHKYDHNNISFVTAANFIIDDEYSASSLAPQVTMWEVNSINFSSCVFRDEQTVSSNTFIPMRGISSLGTGFNVNGCTFENLQLGVLGEDSGSLFNYSINNNEFINCGRAIQNSAVNHISITNNIIEGVGEYPQEHLHEDSEIHEGIYILTGTGFNITDNEVTGNYSSFQTQGSVGICVRQAGTEPNLINNNTVDKLTVGMEALGINNGQFQTGLQYECNLNDGTSTDYFITAPGIAAQQGAINEPAHNQFDYPVSPNNFNAYQHINNIGNQIEYFYYNDPNPVGSNEYEPQESESIGVTIFPLGVERMCEEGNGGSGGIEIGGTNTESIINDLEQELDDIKSEYHQKLSELRDLTDGGDTDGLIIEVQSVLSTQINQLFNRLKSLSPYLSQKVLEEVAKQNHFSNAAKVEIFTANPDEIRSDEFKNYLVSEANLSSFEHAALDAVEQDITDKTLLNLEINGHANQIHKIANAVIVHYLQQENIDYSKLRTWYAHKGSLEAQMKIVDTWLAEENTTMALIALNDINTIESINYQQSEDIDDYYLLKNMQIGLINSNRTIAELNNVEIALLEDIADNSEGIASAQSQSILNFFYDYNYYPLSLLPTNYANGRLIAKEEQTINDAGINYLVVRPNPAKDWTSIQYELPKSKESGTLRIQNIVGQVVFEQRITSSKGIINWLVNDLSKGIYIATLTVENRIYQSEKIIITK